MSRLIPYNLSVCNLRAFEHATVTACGKTVALLHFWRTGTAVSYDRACFLASSFEDLSDRQVDSRISAGMLDHRLDLCRTIIRSLGRRAL